MYMIQTERDRQRHSKRYRQSFRNRDRHRDRERHVTAILKERVREGEGKKETTKIGRERERDLNLTCRVSISLLLVSSIVIPAEVGCCENTIERERERGSEVR